MVLGRPDRLRQLEEIVHPLVRASQDRFLRRACRAGARLVVLDMPLLFETGGDRRVDAVALVWTNPMLQAQRALRRPGMTPEKLAQIRGQQLPDAWKRKRADFVISSGHDGGALAVQVARVIRQSLQRRTRAWPPCGPMVSARERTVVMTAARGAGHVA
jgi:dephospho-CoA kinase